VKANFEVSKTSNHHKSGEIFRASCLVKIDGKEFYADSEAEDLYATVDEVKEKLFNDIERNKDRKQTLFKRGALSVKKMLKGLTKRNPFTSKY
jgi:ribosome-associated translation inhibitor RaiA